MSFKLRDIHKNKVLAIAITLLFAFSMMLIPNAHAAAPYNIPIYAYINASPNPAGVGQQVEVIMWVQTVFGVDGGNIAELTNNYRFSNWVLTITSPSGTNTSTTFTTISSPTSTYDYYYTPPAVGNYMLTFNFPQTQLTTANDGISSSIVGNTYLAASISTNLTVQQTQVLPLPQTPLPTSYWTRPIYGENTAWYTVGSNWLGFGSPGYIALGGGTNLGGNGEEFGTNPDGSTTNVGPLTSHVMWTSPLCSGGEVGQTTASIQANTYADGSAYDQKFTNPIIVDGLLIFREPLSQTLPSNGPTVCLNLQTGKIQWIGTATGTPNNPVPAINFAYVYDPEDPNQHGVWPPMLVSSSWQVYDAFTGDALFNVTSVPSGTTMMGPNGEYLVVYLHNYGTNAAPNWYMLEWNSSRLWENDYSGPSTTPTIPPPVTSATTTVLVNGINQVVTNDFNVSVPWLNTQTLNGALITSYSALAAVQNGVLLVRAGAYPSTGENSFFGGQSWLPYTYYCIGLNTTGLVVGATTPATTATGSVNLGQELWSNTVQPPAGNITVLWAGIDPINHVFVENWRETMQFVGYSLTTGKEIWGPTPEQVSLDYYGSDASGSISDTIAYGNIYSSEYGGIVYCYNDLTGNIVFTYGNGPTGSSNSTNSGVETPFGHYPTFVNAVGSGVIYLVTTEHTQETPIFKGAVASAINATTGALLWQLSDFTGEFETSSYAMADGYAVWFNGYDNQIYCVGQGPSATTVSAPGSGVTTATPVVITGTVTDVSTGTTQFEQKADFPNGVPVCSDASMTAWMGYVYQQQAEPTTFTGVPVQIAVLDSNGNHYVIGTAYTDESGTYHLTWTPDIAGNFTVFATFAGNHGYYGSSAETAFYAGPTAATPAPTASPPSGLATQSTLEYIGVAIIIVIIVIGAVLAVLVSRKR
jgi:hypothetical protein